MVKDKNTDHQIMIKKPPQGGFCFEFPEVSPRGTLTRPYHSIIVTTEDVGYWLPHFFAHRLNAEKMTVFFGFPEERLVRYPFHICDQEYPVALVSLLDDEVWSALTWAEEKYSQLGLPMHKIVGSHTCVTLARQPHLSALSQMINQIQSHFTDNREKYQKFLREKFKKNEEEVVAFQFVLRSVAGHVGDDKVLTESVLISITPI